MLRRRRTRSALEVFVYNRYEDTAFLIFKELSHPNEKSNSINENTPIAWQEIPDNRSQGLPGSSGVNEGSSTHYEEQERQPNLSTILQDNTMHVGGDHTKSTVCVIL